MVRRRPSTLTAARVGDRKALATLWRTYHAPLLRYLRSRRVPSPDDVASQVWIDVATSIGRFEGSDDDFRRWLFTIAHRRSVDQIRKAVRASAPCSTFAVRAADHAAGADTDAEDHDALDRALALVATLPESQAEAVVLRVVNDMSIVDVASVMGISEANVRVLVHRGLTRLRRKLSVTDAGAATMKRVP